MSDKTTRFDRRNVLKGLGALGVLGAGGAALIGGASATAGGSISNPAAVTSDDGEITYVAVQTTGRVTWDGFNDAVNHARILASVDVNPDGEPLQTYDIHDTDVFSITGDWGGSGEETHLTGDHDAGQEGYIASDTDWGILQENRDHIYNNGYGLPQTPGPVEPLFAETDGSQQATEVTLRAEYRLYDANQNELTGTSGYPDRPSFSSSFTVTVNDQESVTGSGDSDAEGDTEDTATVGV